MSRIRSIYKKVAGLLFLILFCYSSFVGTIAAGERPTAFQNLRAGTAGGPEGRTNIQTLADFEDGVVYTQHNQRPDGRFFRVPGNLEFSLVDGGPEGSTKTLRIYAKGAYQNKGEWKYAQFFWTGARQGPSAYIKESRRANAHSVFVKAFDGLRGDRRQNFVIGGYAKQRSPGVMARNNPESHNMHNYFQVRVDWGGSPGVWREILVRNNPTHQRSDRVAAGYEMFLEHAELWPDQTRFYYQFDSGGRLGPGEIFLDNLTFFYENPFLAAQPHSAFQYAQPGERVTFDVVVWNTHPEKTRNFMIRPIGWIQTGTQWGAGRTKVTSAKGRTVSRTGRLEPGQGFPFQVSFKVPKRNHRGQRLGEQAKGVFLISVFENPDQIPNRYPYQQANPFRRIHPRYDLHGIGITLKTLVALEPVVAGRPSKVPDLNVGEVGGSWADLTWTSPALSQRRDETSNDPAASAYAIRYSREPIVDETSWESAVPVEHSPSVLGPNIEQGYAVKGLLSNTRYYAAIRTYNENGEASEIASVSFSTSAADVDLGRGDLEPPPSP